MPVITIYAMYKSKYLFLKLLFSNIFSMTIQFNTMHTVIDVRFICNKLD